MRVTKVMCAIALLACSACVRALPLESALQVGSHYRARVRCTGGNLCEASCRAGSRYRVVLIRPSHPLPSGRETIVDFLVDERSSVGSSPLAGAAAGRLDLYGCTPLLTRPAKKKTPWCDDGDGGG